MATSYLTDAQKTTLNDEFNNLHATFARPITIWKTAEQVIISTDSSNNYMFAGAPGNSETLVIQQSGVFPARILYGKKQTLEMFNSAQWRNSADQNNIWMQEGEARIRLDPTGAAFLAGAKSVTMDGDIFKIVTSKRPHGLFTPNFFDFFVKKEN
jgi:hypothetical protein